MLSDLLERRRAGFSLEPAFYNSEAIFREDVRRVFLANWLFAGHASAIPNPGDYFLFEVADESFIVIRDDRMQIHALSNVAAIVDRESALLAAAMLEAWFAPTTGGSTVRMDPCSRHD